MPRTKMNTYFGWIYLITNIVNEKKYVGLTTLETPKKRYEKHWTNALAGLDYALYRAFRKYGESNFKFEVLYTAMCDNEDELKNCISNMEAYYAEQMMTYIWDDEPGGYNMVWCGDKPTLGFKHTEEELEKMRKAWETRDAPSDLQKKKTSDSLKSFHANANEFQKQMIVDRAKLIGEKQRGRPKKQETKDAISKTLTGRKDSSGVIGNKIMGHTKLGKDGEKYIKTHKYSGWIVHINNKMYGKFSKTFKTLEESKNARNEFLKQFESV
jgi:group I intron endonuclease